MESLKALVKKADGNRVDDMLTLLSRGRRRWTCSEAAMTTQGKYSGYSPVGVEDGGGGGKLNTTTTSPAALIVKGRSRALSFWPVLLLFPIALLLLFPPPSSFRIPYWLHEEPLAISSNNTTQSSPSGVEPLRTSPNHGDADETPSESSLASDSVDSYPSGGSNGLVESPIGLPSVESEEEEKSEEEGGDLPLSDDSLGTCNIFVGDWIPDEAEPLYTNATCFFIQDHMNCMKNGRPDEGYLHWRWKPLDCELPRFNASEFLNRVRGKALAFIGDSIGRNHFQSLLCSISQEELPQRIVHSEDDKNVVWLFPSYNFTLAVLWAPFLVEETQEERMDISAGINKLYLDMPDVNWVSNFSQYDHIVVSSGQWFFQPAIYFIGGKVVGCHYCPGLKHVPEKGFFYAFEKALRTTFEKIISSGFGGTVFFRTFTPDHFENGRWDSGGSCQRTTPFNRMNTSLEGLNSQMYQIQLQEFNRAMSAKTTKKGARQPRWKLVDTIHASLLRPDGHPDAYRSFQPYAADINAKVQKDCLHWCLPGPIDTWNQMLLVVLKQL